MYPCGALAARTQPSAQMGVSMSIDHQRRTEQSMQAATRGFSLVELLVVIGIIAVLISLLLPALSKARQEAQRIQCLSNLHQLAAAAQHYANVTGVYPASHYFVTASDGVYTYDWDWCYAPGAQPTPGLLWL